jgi:uncharacterized membrane protein
MIALISGLVIFFAVHSISIANHDWRNRMADRLGEYPWKAIYSLIALLGFLLIVWGYALARQEPVTLYSPPPWLRQVALLVLLPAFPLLLSTYLPGRIQATARHPMLVATMLWAIAHLLVNGTLADALLFGAFLVWSITDLVSLQYRPGTPVPRAPPSPANDLIAVILGLALYAAFAVWLHAWLFNTPVIEL